MLWAKHHGMSCYREQSNKLHLPAQLSSKGLQACLDTNGADVSAACCICDPKGQLPFQLIACCTNSEEKATTAWGVAIGVAGVLITGVTWLAITYSYRTQKRMVVTEVMRNLKVADIASAEQSAQAAAAQQEAHISNIPREAAVVQDRNLQRTRSVPSTSSSSSRPVLSPTQSSSVQSSRSDSDAVQNPLLLALGFPHATETLRRTEANMHVGAPSKEMKAVARQITVRCLRRWDGVLGIRASSDGLGRRSGIWKDKFDGVHYAVLLLAMNRLNETISNAVQEPSELQPKRLANS